MLTKAELDSLSSRMFSIRGNEQFNQHALELFRIHFYQNPVYGQFVRQLHPGLQPGQLTDYRQIPCLPIELFKSRKVLLDGIEAEDFFTSSGTRSQGAVQSRHYIASLELYRQCFTQAFSLFWGDPRQYVFLALLPNYLEQKHSSLVCMMQELIRLSRQPESGFYLHDLEKLADRLRDLEKNGRKTILFGVSYALLDLAEAYPMKLENTLVFETGGMKGRRREMVKEELHAVLGKAFGIPVVYSEYGMCELLSQAYSTGDGFRFRCPPWMKVLIRQTSNPLQREADGRSGGIDVLDLGNIFSCPFIATQDLGKRYPDESFEMLGRFDNSDVRGCNLMVE